MAFLPHHSILLRIRPHGLPPGLVQVIAVFASALTFLMSPAPACSEARTVTVGVYDMAPLSLRGADGHPQGIIVDIMDAVARSEGWTVRYVYDDWDRLVPMLETRQIDILAPIAFSETRTAYRYNRDYVVIDWGQIWVRRGTRIDMLFDLEGATVGGVSMSIFPAGFNTFARRFGITYVPRDYPDYSALFDALNRGEVTAAVVPRFIGTHHERRGETEPVSIVFSPFEMRYAALRGHADDVIDALDRHLAAYKADKQSVYHASLHRWMRTEDEITLPTWLPYALAASAMLLLALAGVNKALRAQVRRKTEQLSNANDELAGSRDQIRLLLAHQQHATEDIRQRISREVHDELGQNLTALKFGLYHLGRTPMAEEAATRTRLDSMTRLTEETIEAVRRISRELRPGHLDDLGLRAASAWLMKDFESNTGLAIHFTAADDLDAAEAGTPGYIDKDRAVALYRVLQEALTNVARHAGATRIDVSLCREKGQVALTVQDDGHGFDAEGLQGGAYLGIVNMRERVAAYGGRFDMSSGPGGTRVSAVLPLEP